MAAVIATESVENDLSVAATAYLNIRAERERLRNEYETKDAELQKELEQLDELFLKVCNSTNLSSFNTGNATVIRQLKERFISNDWDSFRKFEIANPEYDFRERRIHQGNIKAYMEEHQDDGLPPGVNSMREFQIIVRKK